MWLSLVFVGLLIAVAFKQATQGLFSSLIMLVLSVCCAAAALGSYEYVAGQWLAPLWKPEYALAIALAVTFAVPLMILRVVFDKLVRRSCLLPAMVEKIGAGVLGLMSSLVIVGVAAISLQLVPFAGGSIIGFARLPVVSVSDANASEVEAKDMTSESGLWLSPDRFAAGLGAALLNGAMGSERSFVENHPDLLSTIGWTGAVPAGMATYAPAGSISVRAAQKIEKVYKFTPPETRTGKPAEFTETGPSGGNEFQMVRVRLGPDARDANMSHSFTLRQFQLVGVRDDVVMQFHATAIRLDDASVDFPRHIQSVAVGSKSWPVLDNVYSPGSDNEVEVVFEVPTGFKPSFVEYRRGARAAVKLTKPTDPTASAQPAPPPATGSTPPAAPAARETPSSERSSSGRRSRRSDDSAEAAPDADTSRRGGRVRGVAAEGEESIFGDDLPMTLTAYRQVNNVEVSRGSLSSGHLVAEVDRQAGGTDPPIRKFDVPSDKRLLQLRSTALKAGSTLGFALAQAVTTAQAYFVEDDRGQRYELAGKYVIADDNGTQVFEVQYFSEPVGSIGGIGKFSRVNEKNLKSDDTFVLLFLVDPGARIVSFSTGGAASRKDDLAGSNLVAPQ